MRTIRTKVYKFNELQEEAKQRAIKWYRETDSFGYKFAWDNTEEDAKEIGLKIIELSAHRNNSGEFMLSANEVAQNIFNNHGESCETYKTAKSFMENWQPIFNNYMQTEEGEAELMGMETEFLNDLLEDYRIMYNNDIDYQNSDEYIIDAIEANEYEFKKDGTPF